MDGRGGSQQTAFLQDQKCDVLLLTEVKDSWSLPGYRLTGPGAEMTRGKRWAAIAFRLPLVSRPPASPPVPHPASVAAVLGGTTYVSSILPWAGSGGEHPWQGDDHPTRMANTLDSLAPFLDKQTDLVWGGDWNHSLGGPERAGSKAGRRDLLSVLQKLRLNVPTAGLSHYLNDLLTIDHIALRNGVEEARRVVAVRDGKRLSDHDLYLVVSQDELQ
jgi:hypothetical protein